MIGRAIFYSQFNEIRIETNKGEIEHYKVHSDKFDVILSELKGIPIKYSKNQIHAIFYDDNKKEYIKFKRLLKKYSSS